MSTEKRTAANRANAKRSTGPRSAAGKATAAKNALAHGLCAAAPVLPGEQSTGWDRHRAGVLAALKPVGGLEDALAERVAACLWRLRRVVAYETAVTAAGLAEAAEPPRGRDDELSQDHGKDDRSRLRKVEKDLTEARTDAARRADAADLFDRLADLPDAEPVSGRAVEGVFADLNGAIPGDGEEYFDTDDPEFLTGLRVPEGYRRDPSAWPGWTAGLVRKAAAAVAAEFKLDAADLIARAAADRAESQRWHADNVAKLEAEVADLQRRVESRAVRRVIRSGLPDADTLDKVSRYEAHLSRQMLQALNTLERLQAVRSGKDVPPPAAGTLVVDAPPPAVLGTVG